MSSQLKRCAFAIISHPDAGKTTITEKLLWFGQVIRKMGMVKSKSGQFATSDWMKMEQDRGISITSSVMSYEYRERLVHLLDTPGHKDFSEDTYRTLTAVESVLMMIDAAKGVEEQTLKLMQVCRLRDTPIITFMNKFDRDGLSAFDLIDNVEKTCSIQCIPMTWPIGQGGDFKGVYDIARKKIVSFKESNDPFSPDMIDADDLDTEEVRNFCGVDNLEKLKEDLEMVHELIPPLNMEEFLAGIQTPVFFGTALYNFGVKEVLDFITQNAPGPKSREAYLMGQQDESGNLLTRTVTPDESQFSGMVFKIQANMDKRHRDRMSFMRVCSGSFKRGDKLFHVRSSKDIKISTPVFFVSRDRELVEEAFAGDIVGINGAYQIGDTFTSGEKIRFTGIPSFAPEFFMKVILKDPLKAKHLDKGLQQLSEEGAVQLFTRTIGSEKILGAVGMLQFDVVKHRLEDEYNVRGEYSPLPYKGIRWPKFESKKQEETFKKDYSSHVAFDVHGKICVIYRDTWDLKMMEDKNKDILFCSDSESAQ